MAPAPTRATPARERMRGHRCPGGHGDAGQRGLPQNLHARRSGCLGGQGRSHSWVTQEKRPRGAGMHLGARAGRAPAAVADGPQARVGAAETEKGGSWCRSRHARPLPQQHRGTWRVPGPTVHADDDPAILTRTGPWGRRCPPSPAHPGPALSQLRARPAGRSSPSVALNPSWLSQCCRPLGGNS